MEREEFNKRYAKYIEELGGVEAYKEIAKERDRQRNFRSGYAWGILSAVAAFCIFAFIAKTQI